MNTYEETYESLTFLLKKNEEIESAKAAPAQSDMFADDFNEKNPMPQTTSSTSLPDDDDDVKWEYRKGDANEGDIHGPVTTSVLMDLTKADDSGKAYFVRKHGSSGQFYSSSRVDFSLYID